MKRIKCPECGAHAVVYDDYNDCYRCESCGSFFEAPDLEGI